MSRQNTSPFGQTRAFAGLRWRSSLFLGFALPPYCRPGQAAGFARVVVAEGEAVQASHPLAHEPSLAEGFLRLLFSR